MKNTAIRFAKVTLLAGVIATTLTASAVPSVTVTSPKRNANLTNGVLNAAGTAKGSLALPITNVFYSFNGGGWASANGTTNWTIPNLPLTPGSNSLWVYAVDSGAVSSLTNKVVFTYVVKVPATVLTNGPGMVNPNYNGKLLQIGKSYVANAQPKTGFGFTGWTGDLTNANKHLKFVMQSNLTLVANFVDIAPPKLAITSPLAKQSISNSPVNATCRATDNVGVTAVNYQINGGSWETDATTSDGTNWTMPNLEVVPGPNTLKVRALDAMGNISLTNTVAFTYAPPPFTGYAPKSLAGMKGTVTGAMIGSQLEEPFEISFGTSTFAISTTDTNDDVAAGNYTYTVLGSNTVQLTTFIILPPHEVGGMMTNILEFTTNNVCVFTNSYDNSLATITLEPVAKLVPSSSAILTIQHQDGNGNTGVSVFSGGVFTNYSNYGTGSQSVDSWGNYYLEPFSPDSAMLMKQYANPLDAGSSDATLLNFITNTNGTWFDHYYDTNMDLVWTGAGTFQVIATANPPAGNAPLSLAGKLISVSQGGRSFKLCFGENTYTMFDVNTNDDNTTVSDYAYIKTGPNMGTLFDHTILPPLYANLTDLNLVQLTFNSASSGTAYPQGGSPANFSVATANNYAPTSLAGKTISANGGSGVFGNDGTFTYTKNGSSETGTYTYAQFSPVGGMVVVSHPASDSFSYVQVQFNSATSGSAYEVDYYLGNVDGFAVFNFTLK